MLDVFTCCSVLKKSLHHFTSPYFVGNIHQYAVVDNVGGYLGVAVNVPSKLPSAIVCTDKFIGIYLSVVFNGIFVISAVHSSLFSQG